MREIMRVEPPCPPLPRRKRVAAYVRVSCGKDAMLHSLSAQVSYFSNYIQHHPGWDYAGAFVDEAITGTKEDRPQFQRLLSECRTGNIDIIVTKAVSRFARNTVVLLKTVRELKEIGVDVYFQEQNIHTLSNEGELLLTILAAFAQEESRSVSENCKWRIRNDFKVGKPTPVKVLGYTFRDRKFIPNPAEIDIIKMIFNDYVNGMGSTAIVKKLRSMGMRFSRNRVLNILRNEKYAGDLLLQKTYSTDHLSKKIAVNDGDLPMYYVKNSHEGLVERDTHKRVQEIAKARAARFHPNPRKLEVYPFTQMIHCDICGALYRRNIAGSAPKYKKPVWRCKTYNDEGKAVCASQQIPEKIIIEKTVEALGLPVFDEIIFKQRIREIHVPAHNRLVFIFYDGTTKELTWENPSRRDSWTQEMKEKASHQTKERNTRQ